jgi:hypothetical protein
VAQIINVNKNRLRAEHALALANGRATLKKKKAEEAANELTLEELHCLDSILSSFSSRWHTPAHGNLLWRGVSGEGARSPADAFAKWQADGAHFVTTGLSHDFGPKRLQEFAEVKRAAARLTAARK